MTLDELKAAIRGTVITAGDAHWGATLDGLVWNGRKPGAMPPVIVRAKDARDVQTAVRFAAAQGLKVSARSSGHNWSGIAAQDGLVIDMGAMDTIRVDRAAMQAEVGPGAKNLALAAAFTAAGVAFPLGHCGDVSAGGYLLGGGIGWNGGHWGIACNAVVSAEVVLADGSLIEASATENAQVYWALRGAGPAFFGIVTRYRIRVFDLPRAIAVAVRVYPLHRAAEVTRWMQGAAAVMPTNVELTMTMAPAPAPMEGRVATAVMTVFADDMADASATVDALWQWAPADALHVQPPAQVDFATLYAITDAHYPEGLRYAVDSAWTADPATVFPALARMVADAPAKGASALGFVYAQASRVLQDLPDGAFQMVAPALGLVHAGWSDPADDAANLAWLRGGMDRIAHATLGHYVGEADLARPGRLAACYAGTARHRIEVLRLAYDPTGVFAGRVVRDGDLTCPMALAAE